MLTINLEKELLRQNKSILTSKELLLIKEYEKVADFIEDDSLIRIGVTGAGRKGEQIKNKVARLNQQTKDFDQTRVFHISQIEKLCNKYYLKFLPSYLFSGQIDKELPFKINNFEAAYNVKCRSGKDSYDNEYRGSNTYIAAPQESFNIQERPIDPLLFFKINEEYYYLIHKWGNDLSITRAIKGFLSNGAKSILFTLSVFFISLLISLVSRNIVSGVFTFISGLMLLIHFVGSAVHEKWLPFYDENNYNSPFKN